MSEKFGALCTLRLCTTPSSNQFLRLALARATYDRLLDGAASEKSSRSKPSLARPSVRRVYGRSNPTGKIGKSPLVNPR
ncbi:hypothetical protein F441_07254 [Phytophthora nicotianae CJ01A1]|uniref:Uncharacterized protein n=2 Tax=Phytophthora nicotianae TaxID=4792 RepID=V9FBC7_PHYNI|nr:hypothetical protein F443_07238 [Phytophthora nicotianae P1569]ETP18549.1 hypothetical protein F441_07254 [Phytophthora nicotianae CJ01A1]